MPQDRLASYSRAHAVQTLRALSSDSCELREVDKFTRAIVMVREVQPLSQNGHTRMLIDESSPSIAPACLRTAWHHTAGLMQARHCVLSRLTHASCEVDKFTRAIVMAREVQSLSQNAHTHMLIDESSPSIAPVCLRATWHHTAELMQSRHRVPSRRTALTRASPGTNSHVPS